MAVRKGRISDLKKIALLYKTFFKVHNVFSQSEGKIVLYLKMLSKKENLFLYEEGNSIKAVLFLSKKTVSKDKKHILWTLKHFAFSSNDSGSKLVKAAENIVKKSSKTSKIEINVAKSEPEFAFYKKIGYLKEAELKNHYRWKESCFVFSKCFN